MTTGVQDLVDEAAQSAKEGSVSLPADAPRRRGRPKGSKNRPKATSASGAAKAVLIEPDGTDTVLFTFFDDSGTKAYEHRVQATWIMDRR